MRRDAAFWLCMVLLMTAGCSDAELTALDARLAELRAQPAGKVAPLPQAPQYQTVSYDQADGRSPFMPERSVADQQRNISDLAPDLSRPRDPLEAYSLDSLKLVGILSVDERRSALVRDPEGRVHRLHVGAYMGTDYGRIVSITNASVQLVEVVPNGQGGWTERSQNISLNRDVDQQSRG